MQRECLGEGCSTVWDWMRATPAKKHDQRSRGSGGGSSGVLVQHKSSGSWRRGEAGGRLQQNVVGGRGKTREENDLHDDVSSPLKQLSHNTTIAAGGGGRGSGP